MVQTEVKKDLAFGIVGEVSDTTPSVVDTYVIASGSVPAEVGLAYTLVSEGVVEVGGSGEFVGIAVNPKEYLNYNGDLSPNSELKAGTAVSLMTKGRVTVDIGATSAIGEDIFFATADGKLSPTAGDTQIANTEVVKFGVGANGLALIELGKVT